MHSPIISNARQVIVSGGTANFQTTLNDFASNTTYKYRAYAKNSKGEYAYSQVITFTTFRNYCEPYPCKNAGICRSSSSGATCICTITFCGDCCAQLADASCPGGSEVLCPVASPIAYADNLDKNKFQNNIIKTATFKNIWVNTGKAIFDESTINTTK